MIIHGYELTTDWKVVGGMSEVAFARKDGKEWFIKKFISPKYPLPESPGSERMKEKQRKKCEVFERRHKDINSRISTCCGLGGNLIYAVDFFRDGSCYYKINERIKAEDMSISDISSLEYRNLLIIMRSLVHSLRILHHANIVHGDLKPDNILIKLTSTGVYTTKLIDFDDSYISGAPPEDHSQIVGTPEYYSPEVYEYITDEDGIMSRKALTVKSDIFALGVIFSEYLTGSKPIIPKEYGGTYAAVAAGANVEFEPSEHLTPKMEKLLQSLLQKDPAKRPSIDEVFRSLPLPTPKKKSTPKIIRFSTLKSSVIRGDKVYLTWAAENCNSVTINGNDVALAGSASFPAEEKFTIIASDPSGETATKVINIAIKEPDPSPFSALRGTMFKRSTK